jgi:RNA polymerase sigma-70 factor (ECF subfamily)
MALYRCSEPDQGAVTLTKRDLVIRARAGDHAAFTVLAGEAIGRMETTAWMIVRDRQRAQDAVQDALLSAWLDIRGVRDPDRFDTWLNRLLVRACYKLARRDRRRRLIEVTLLPVHDRAVYDRERAVDARDELERAFVKLTPQERAVLVTHFYLGLADAEAADALGIALGTLKSRLSRAKQAMRVALEADARAAELGGRRLA